MSLRERITNWVMIDTTSDAVDGIMAILDEELAHARNEAYDEAREGIAKAIDLAAPMASVIDVSSAISFAREWTPQQKES